MNYWLLDNSITGCSIIELLVIHRLNYCVLIISKLYKVKDFDIYVINASTSISLKAFVYVYRGEQEHENKTAIDVQKEKDNKERIGEEPTENGSMKGNDVEKGDKDKDSSDNETEEERIRRKTLEHEDRIRKETLTEVPVAKPRPLRRYIVMVVLIGLATLIAMLTDNVLILAEITGSYPGVGVQYIIPSLIVIFARR